MVPGCPGVVPCLACTKQRLRWLGWAQSRAEVGVAHLRHTTAQHRSQRGALVWSSRAQRLYAWSSVSLQVSEHVSSRVRKR